MSDNFHDIRHRHTTYDRPNQQWICGAQCQGKSCYLGPDTCGRCQAGAVFDGRRSGECLPRRSGDRWLCTRVETDGGQPCAEGPLPDGSCCREVIPCQPKPTLRKVRGTLTRVLVIVTIALLALLLGQIAPGGARGTAALNPGPLSAAHSALGNRCDQCHSNMNLGPERLLSMRAGDFDHRALADGKLCLSCHQEIGGSGGRHAFSPHTMGAEKLSPTLGEASHPDALLKMALLLTPATARRDQMGCVACHGEHNGLAADLKAFTNRQCQICHRQQFESFTRGHPEFEVVSYPARRRTRIFFDHLSHYSKHFPEKQIESPASVPAGFRPATPHRESVSCAACHATEARGGMMTVVSYEKACASCHAADTHSGNKLPMIAFPRLDTESLNARLAAGSSPRTLGSWPADAPNEFPWLLLHLLHPEARAAWSRLETDGVTTDNLAALKPERTADAERLAWGVKELFRDLCADSPSQTPSGEVGQREIVRRLREAGSGEPEALINGLPPDAFDQMRMHFGAEFCQSTMKEVDDYRAKIFPALKAEPVREERPAVNPPAPPPGGSESFGTPGGASESFGAPAKPAAPAAGGESFGAAPAPAAESFGAVPAPARPDRSHADRVAPAVDPVDRLNWVSTGGWHHEYGAVYYKSTGHADPLLRAWLHYLVADVRDSLRLATLREGFGFSQGWMSPATGHCLKCHTIEERRDGEGQIAGAIINWYADGKEPGADRPLTHYNHQSHLLFADCRRCHVTIRQPSPDREYAVAFPAEGSWNAERRWFEKAGVTHFHSNFQQIAKSTCAQCHTAAKSGDGCLQCHSYHHPAPDGPASMLEWLRGLEARPDNTNPGDDATVPIPDPAKP